MSYPALLDALHDRTAGDHLVASASGVVIASGESIAGDHPLTRFGLGVGRRDPDDPLVLERFADGLLDLHRQLLRRGIDHAVEHLNGRTSGDTTLLDRQLVQASLADVAVEIRESEALRPDDPASRWRAHQGLTAAGRLLLTLLGASSFLVTGPGGELHLAEVTGNVYLHPGEEDR
ncbi:acyl-CoA dehydrogenase family protein [Umezawaea tangerina]|uniref:Acyl-CoA dehydrogenase-like protein n=1 Tax=Umezawaea tangerina TaxID=84725 RepID=A0A2T0SXL3_9PSEU|nr:acyl-CoA dehydrogenase family protein [Umezawaea tangerina]PRY38130.1 acyl-CoA dehydrogenase-like protein [Umezawaea tangerina]